MELGRDHLKADIGFIAILHTWGQNLIDHPHIHCIIPVGGLSHDGKRWVSSRNGFFMPVKVLSRMFRGKFLHYLKKEYDAGNLKFPGKIREFETDFKSLIGDLYKDEWVVYCKPPFQTPEKLFQYLSRYTHRVAISNDRIYNIRDVKVTFRWRDYADGNKDKLMTLDAFEFIRRFLLHVLPDGFVKIRYYGLLSNRNRKTKLRQCRELLGVSSSEGEREMVSESLKELVCMPPIDPWRCPFCGGRMFTREILYPIRGKSPPHIERLAA